MPPTRTRSFGTSARNPSRRPLSLSAIVLPQIDETTAAQAKNVVQVRQDLRGRGRRRASTKIPFGTAPLNEPVTGECEAPTGADRQATQLDRRCPPAKVVAASTPERRTARVDRRGDPEITRGGFGSIATVRVGLGRLCATPFAAIPTSPAPAGSLGTAYRYAIAGARSPNRAHGSAYVPVRRLVTTSCWYA